MEITVRGDSHYGCHEAMTWCEASGVGYILGLGINAVLKATVRDLTKDAALARLELEDRAGKVRRHGGFRYGAKSWKCEHCVIARIERC